ncbi:RDD family protein [Cellulomonas cellasea]|uniref:RDD family protein n=1 Tax=Cellulomonas cellasea TaxID=43670 RepID=UPI0025A47E30|nr:RDD family protein [Cellulomonas cellasea]MDM8085508.1 RDD family protein [Cellulomonas cellasea]
MPPDQVAAIGPRVVALLVDQLAAGSVAFGGLVLAGVVIGPQEGLAILAPPLIALALGGVVAITQWIAEARTGMTLGNLLLGIRTVSSDTGLPAGVGRVLLRNVVVGLGGLVFGVGAYVVAGSGAWDRGPAQRGWHDQAAGTLVLRRSTSAPVTRRGTAAAPAVFVRPAPAHASVAPASAAPAPAAPASATPASDRPSPSPVPASAPGPVTVSASAPSPVPVSASAPGPALAPVFEPAPVPTPSAVAVRLVFDTGERVDVVGDGAVGRGPADAHAAPLAHAVAIDDPSRSISKLHLVFGPEPSGLWLIDRGSTNGTVLMAPDGSLSALPAGDRAHIGPGWSVRFGERSFRVEAR